MDKNELMNKAKLIITYDPTDERFPWSATDGINWGHASTAEGAVEAYYAATQETKAFNNQH